MGTDELNAGGALVMDEYPIQRGVEILVVASCCGNWRLVPPLPAKKLIQMSLILGQRLQNYILVNS